MEETAEIRVRVPQEFLEEVRMRKEGRRLEASDSQLRAAFAAVFQAKCGELLRAGELHVRDAHKLVLEEAESKRPDGEGFASSLVKARIPIPEETAEKAVKIREDYTGGRLAPKRSDVLNAITSVLKCAADEMLVEGEVQVKDLYLLILEKLG